MKSIDEFGLSDFSDYKVWKFASDEFGDIDYDNVVPVRKEAVVMENDIGVIVPIKAALSNSEKILGLASVNGDAPEILPGPTFFINNDYFSLMLPPAPSFVLEQQGPEILATILKLPIRKIFPIALATDVIFNKTGKTLTVVLSNEIA